MSFHSRIIIVFMIYAAHICFQVIVLVVVAVEVLLVAAAVLDDDKLEGVVSFASLSFMCCVWSCHGNGDYSSYGSHDCDDIDEK